MLMVTTTVGLLRSSVSAFSASAAGSLTWSTGFIATPRVFGHEFRLTANLCFARDASAAVVSHPSAPNVGYHILSNGLSGLPPPATIPIMPLELLATTFFAPLGSLTLVLPSSGL